MKKILCITSVLAGLVIGHLVTTSHQQAEIARLKQRLVVEKYKQAFDKDPGLNHCLGYVKPSPEMKKILRIMKLQHLDKMAQGR